MHPAHNDVETEWFCLISQPKHEHIAAAQLADQHGIEVFAPRIRFRRPTRNGPVWVTEALFPNYFFAKVGRASVRRVHHAREVRGIVHFGNSWPSIPSQTIEELKRTVGSANIHVISTEFTSGDEVKIIEGSFYGFEAVVSRVISAHQRVAVLLDFLGRQTVVELDIAALVKNTEQRELLFKAA